ncbi:MAG TPA: carotenoid 1,2-hydratase, partial [Magnetospirillaceae bacterium]|nr:carotenoid 1,2-hydratase [Magnetospirillaceae bacterium]
MYYIALVLFLLTMLEPALAAPPDYPPITADAPPLDFPRDGGAHPAFRTEWWYLTGWLQDKTGAPVGFQVTFFRSRPDVDQDNPSTFAARQVMMAHAALSDPKRGRLLHDQRVARLGPGRTKLSESGLDLAIDDWTWQENTLRIPAKDFILALTITQTQALLPEGPNAVSAKGRDAASRYYSLPHLAVTAELTRDGHREQRTGEAWFDHEWSSTLLPDKAVGWDWAALDLSDGGALMAFRIRDAQGATLWAGGTWRDRDGSPVFLREDDVSFDPKRRWHSPHSGADYPVETDLTVTLNG